MNDRMADMTEVQLTGMVTDVFARHIILLTPAGRFLAELSPAAAGDMSFSEGDCARLSGEIHGSDVKVTWIARIEADNNAIEAASALSRLEANGFTVLTEGRHEQTHIEFLISEDRGGGLFELHTELDGRLRKLKLVHEHDPKWGPALR